MKLIDIVNALHRDESITVAIRFHGERFEGHLMASSWMENEYFAESEIDWMNIVDNRLYIMLKKEETDGNYYQ